MTRVPPSPLSPLPMPSTGERVAERLAAAISLGYFVAGQRLPSERDLAEMLQISRAPVREAIQRLQFLGHLAVRRGRAGGAFVTGAWSPESDAMVRRALLPEWDRIDQLLDLRRMLEREIAATAAQRHDPNDRARIAEALHRYTSAENREESRVADVLLHGAIATAAHNPLVVRMSAQLRQEINLGFDAEPYSQELRGRALQQHPALVRAITDRDAETAARLAGEHFDLTDVAMRHAFERVMPTSLNHRKDPTGSTPEETDHAAHRPS